MPNGREEARDQCRADDRMRFFSGGALRFCVRLQRPPAGLHLTLDIHASRFSHSSSYVLSSPIDLSLPLGDRNYPTSQWHLVNLADRTTITNPVTVTTTTTTTVTTTNSPPTTNPIIQTTSLMPHSSKNPSSLSLHLCGPTRTSIWPSSVDTTHA